MKPSVALRVVPTHVSTAAITGAPHGAATTPDAAPIANAPPSPPPLPASAAFRITHAGIGNGIASSITSANSNSRFPIANNSHGFVLTVPKSVPDSPASTPSSAYTSARPSAYEMVSANGRHRERAPVLSPPTSATVIGIIG